MSDQATYDEHVYQEYKHGEFLTPLYRREKVVRCGDCAYYVEDPEPIDPGWPMMCEESGRDMLAPNGFCAWCLRRDG